MYNRYKRTPKILNNSELYSDTFKSKNVSYINQYVTYNFNKLKFIEESDVESIIHIIQPFDKLYMISQKYYNSPDYGWLILYTNKIGSEMHLNIGDPLTIYLPLESLLRLL